MSLLFNYWIFDIFLVILCGFGILYVYVISSHDYWKKRGVKSVPKPNFFGNFSDCIFARKPLRDLLSELYFHGEDEKFVGFYVFDKPFLILRDPETIKNVLVRDFKNFTNRCVAPNHDDFIGSVNIFSLRNPAWKILRQKLSPVFTSSKLKNMFDSIVETAEDLNVHLQSTIPDGQWNAVDVKELCEKFTTDVIGRTMFGMKLNALNNPNAEFRNEGKKHFQNSYGRYFSLLSLFFMPRLAKLFRITFFDPDVPTFFKRVIPEAMLQRQKSSGKGNDLLDAFLDIKESYSDKNDDFYYYFQDDGLIATSIVFFLGGFEPSASMMYFTLYELSKKPEIQNKLRQEILEALEETNGKISYEMVMSLPYLDMVSSEGLRKYPLLHFLDREAEESYKFSDTNVTIDKGTPLIIPLSALHMDPRYYENPEDFDPERFSPENKKKIPPFAYIPFGEGPRNCIGMRLGLAQAKVGLIQIISKYEIAPCEKTPIPLTFDSYTLFTKSKYNMELNIRKIDK